MNRLTSKNLRWIRNIIMVGGMIVILILWLYIPSIIENNRQVHVGNGKYGSKLGFLLMVPFPLLGLIPEKPNLLWEGEEIHTDDAKERAELEEKQKIESLKVQILLSVFGFMVACFGIILAILLG